MSNGRHLVILPIVYAVILPLIIFIIPIYLIPKFFSNLLIILGGIFVAWNIIEFYLIFLQHKGNYKKFSNAMLTRRLIKLFFLFSIILVGSELFLEYNKYGTFLSQDTLHQFEPLASVYYQYKMAFLLSFLYSLIPLMTFLFFSGFNYGQSYAYFQIGLGSSKKIQKINAYQNALESYNHYLIEILGIKLKNKQQIESKILADNITAIDETIKSLFPNHDDKLKPAIELSNWIDVDSKNVFQANSFLENYEKLSRFLPPIATIIAIAVGVYLHFNQP